MDKKDYEQLLTNVLKEFRKPGEALEIAGVYQVAKHNNVHCGLCGWPETSSQRRQFEGGLINVFVLRNSTTNKSLLVGAKCAKNYEKHLQETEPEATINGLSEAMDYLGRLDRRKKPKRMGEQSPPIGRYAGPDPFVPDDYQGQLFEEQDDIYDETSPENYWDYFGDDEDRVPTRDPK